MKQQIGWNDDAPLIRAYIKRKKFHSQAAVLLRRAAALVRKGNDALAKAEKDVSTNVTQVTLISKKIGNPGRKPGFKPRRKYVRKAAI
jgi:hypothetical protein